MPEERQQKELNWNNILVSIIGGLLLLLLGWVKQDVNELKSTLNSLVVSNADNRKDIQFTIGTVEGIKLDCGDLHKKVDVLYQREYLKEDEIDGYNLHRNL